jgi:hypothetical protein
MRGLMSVAALALLVAACTPPANEAATAPAQTAAPEVTAPAAAAGAGASFAEAVGQFDPAVNRFVWVLPQGVHGEEPWTMNVTVKHKGEVKYETRIPLKAEIVPAGTHAEIPATSETVRLTDGGTWKTQMAEVGKVIEDLIAQHGRGDGEMLMETELNSTLDATGKQKYCVEKQEPVIEVYIENANSPTLTKLDMSPLAMFLRQEVLENCGT